KNDVYVEADELVCQLGKSLVVSIDVAVLEANVLTLDIPEIIESLSKRVDGRPGLHRQDTDRDYFPSRLLRPCGERPSRRTADQSDELAAVHVWMAPAWQEIIWRAAQRSLAVMCPACWCSPGGLLALMGSANRVLIIRTGSMSR